MGKIRGFLTYIYMLIPSSQLQYKSDAEQLGSSEKNVHYSAQMVSCFMHQSPLSQHFAVELALSFPSTIFHHPYCFVSNLRYRRVLPLVLHISATFSE